jgi:hypothetical protein
MITEQRSAMSRAEAWREDAMQRSVARAAYVSDLLSADPTAPAARLRAKARARQRRTSGAEAYAATIDWLQQRQRTNAAGGGGGGGGAWRVALPDAPASSSHGLVQRAAARASAIAVRAACLVRLPPLATSAASANLRRAALDHATPASSQPATTATSTTTTTVASAPLELAVDVPPADTDLLEDVLPHQLDLDVASQYVCCAILSRSRSTPFREIDFYKQVH